MGTAAPGSLQLWGQEHLSSAGGSWVRLETGTGLGGRSWQSKDVCPAQSSYHMLAPTLLPQASAPPAHGWCLLPAANTDTGLSA